MDKQQAVLDALELELQFIEGGGYDPSVREPRKELTIFRDSPSCLNYALPLREHLCSECWLIDFVPTEKRGEAFPCHHIPLNNRGDTIASLGDGGSRIDAQETVRGWLLTTIQRVKAASE
jgi:hypothetical protein